MHLVILGRDGVISRRGIRPRTPEQWEALPGSLDAIARMNHAGFRVVVATNQPRLARPGFDIEDLNRIHAKLYRQLAEKGGHIDAFFFCPHDEKERCDCRKPRPGLLHQISSRLRTSVEGVPMVGCYLGDIQAARAAGAQPVYLHSNGGRELSQEHLEGVKVFDGLPSFVDSLIAKLSTAEAAP